MPTYAVRIARRTRKALEGFPPRDRMRILTAIRRLATEPRAPGGRKLTGEDDLWRIRVGAYRVIYSVRDKDLLVLVAKVARRDRGVHLMPIDVSSGIMARTTIDIEGAVLRELKQLREREGKTLGQLVSELVAAALARRASAEEEAPPFQWTARAMGARVDLEDKEAVRAALESD